MPIRNLIAVSLILVALGVTSYQVHAAELNFPAQSLGESLRSLGNQTKTNLLFDPGFVKDLQAPAVSGASDVTDALTRLLLGSGLTYRFIDARTVTLIPVDGVATSKGNAHAIGSASTADVSGADRVRLVQSEGASASSSPAAGEGAPKGADEDRKNEISEVIVTATKREQRIKDVPMSIAAVSQDAIEQQGIQSLLDLSRIVPGLVVSETGPGQSRMFLRGVANGNVSTSLVGIYFDEIPVTGVSLGQRDIQLVDLERVEVLRGPQGTLYGQGSAGGTLRYISRKPELDRRSAEFDLTGYATDGGDFSEKLTGVVNLPVVEDTFGVRISGTVAEIGGWNDLPAAGREDINNQSIRDVRVRALWQASDALAINATAIVHRNEGGGISAMPDENYDVSYPNSDPLTQQSLEDDFDIYNVMATYDFGQARLLSSTSYIESASAYSGLAFKFPGQDIVLSNVFDIESFAQELRLSSTGEGKLNWVLGGFYTDDTMARLLSLDINTGGTTVAVVPLPTTTRSETYSIFGDASYAITDRLDLGVGVRYFNDDREESGAGQTLSSSFNSVDPRFYAAYALTENVNLYANVAKGFRSGGFLGDAAASTFDPEKVWSYEVGTKGSAGRFSWDLSLYFSDYKDYQAFVQVSSVLGGIENAGDAEIKGIDWLFALQATGNLFLQLSGNVTDTELVSVTPGAAANVEGDPLDLIYDYSITASADYRFDWTTGMQGFARLDFSQIGPSTLTDHAFGVVKAPSDTIQLLGARIGIERGRWAAELFGQNLLGEDGLQDPFWPFGWTSRPRPPTYGLTVRTRF